MCAQAVSYYGHLPSRRELKQTRRIESGGTQEWTLTFGSYEGLRGVRVQDRSAVTARVVFVLGYVNRTHRIVKRLSAVRETASTAYTRGLTNCGWIYTSQHGVHPRADQLRVASIPVSTAYTRGLTNCGWIYTSQHSVHPRADQLRVGSIPVSTAYTRGLTNCGWVLYQSAQRTPAG